ncbi:MULTISPECIES: NUDIX hydrolase [unclassified Microbulbifer]|uniref:NUDIX domain-containing protein n=1 Tax=Microbulbifer spongiae TaxID=2944933 RepID=A0ABY9E8P8_9GAMM|nr:MULTISPECIES: NUDIX domain-containing protein [unclassified Microbulbifer]MDP5210177.1 NUDIX domain-containing protein [Microbulbifer sp. 2205BS26-8]WKD48692.1 NUDIX domain-containing protein [Microbulbifer sp. MI-G]
MGFEDCYRLSAHAVITNDSGEVLQLLATYANRSWGLPGGALDPGETVHEALRRECREELGRDVYIDYLSGVYYHRVYNAHVFIFRARLAGQGPIVLSHEHSEMAYFPLEQLSAVQVRRVRDCLEFDGRVHSAKF